MLKKIKNIAADLGLFVLLFASLFLCFAVIRTNLIWGNVSIEQILINMVEANNEAAQEIVEGYVIWTLIPALLLCTILTGLIKNNLYLCLIMLLSCGYSAYKLELAQFLINRNTYSEIYEKEYINPQNITFDFPDKKQNLIILHLESMEKNYADASLVGQNLLPNLSELAKQNISFINCIIRIILWPECWLPIVPYLTKAFGKKVIPLLTTFCLTWFVCRKFCSKTAMIPIL